MDVADRFLAALLDGAFEVLTVAVPAAGGSVLLQDYRRYAVHFLPHATVAYHCQPGQKLAAGNGYAVPAAGEEQRFNRLLDSHLPTAEWFVVPDVAGAFTVQIAVGILRDWGVSRAFEQSEPLKAPGSGDTIAQGQSFGDHY